MNVIHNKPWLIKESEVTDEGIYLDRRRIITALGGLTIAPFLPSGLRAAENSRSELYKFTHNPKYVLDRELTPENFNLTFNNFYEFGSSKDIAAKAQALKPRPWTVEIDGLVENKLTLDIDDLLAKISLEERLYRHRCVEAWSMTIPWMGFPMKKLLELANPLSSAKYVRFETFMNRDIATGQRSSWYPWPYVEGFTLKEAENELAFMAVGAYGKPISPQQGTPIRVVMPWKYGFKSIKSIVRMTITDKRPVSFWEEIAPAEYGFWANVNPEVPHPRWSQAKERILQTGDYIPTLLFNGYADQVAHLYTGLSGVELYR